MSHIADKRSARQAKPSKHRSELTTTAPGVVDVKSDASLRLSSLVSGAPVDGDGRLFKRRSPADGEKLYEYCAMSADEISGAVGEAHSALSDATWRVGRNRSRALLQAAQLIESKQDVLAALVVAETGKPIREARGEVQATVNAFEYFAGIARDNPGKTFRSVDPHRFSFTVKEPAGVAGLIIPWNFPLGVLSQKLAPALAAGCPVIVKPSPLAALSPLVLLSIISEAGFPDGAVNLVLGGAATGKALVEHPGVRVISFTGSSAVGRAIVSSASKHRLKKLAIEAGGNAPAIVFDDADISVAVRGLVFGSLFNQGECCVATSRTLVHEAVKDDVLAQLIEEFASVRIGDPYDERTQMGPLISEGHCTEILAKLDKAREGGATIVSGGEVFGEGQLPGGPYLHPAIVDGPGQNSELIQEEIFGPVITLQSFRSDDEALALANDSKYGLGAAIWTTSLSRALYFSQHVRAGDVWVNGCIEAFPELPISGRGDSGFSMEFGREGLEFFSETRSVQFVTDPRNAGLQYGEQGPSRSAVSRMPDQREKEARDRKEP